MLAAELLVISLAGLQGAVSKTCVLCEPVAQHLPHRGLFGELWENRVVQLLQFQKGIHHRTGKACPHMSTGIGQKFMHQVSELLISPK